jgi:pimeloyl-ACP methyl ester carboxylesterase
LEVRPYRAKIQPWLNLLAERLLEALDRLNVQRFHLVGHHTGGSIALEIFQMARFRLQSLTLIGPVVAPPEARSRMRSEINEHIQLDGSGKHLQQV